MPIIDIHTHCSPRERGDPFGLVQALRPIPAGRNLVTSYRGLPAVAYHEMFDLELQQEVCARAGISGRIISNLWRRQSGCRDRGDWPVFNRGSHPLAVG